MRVKKLGFSNVKEEFLLWAQCATEVVPLIKRHHSEIGNSVWVIFSNLISLFKETQKNFEENSKKEILENFELQKKIKNIEDEANKMRVLINQLQTSKRLELEQISKEIAEIFGGEENEIQLLKLKTKRFQDLASSGTAEYLRELYQRMNKNYSIPETKTYDIPTMNLEDFDKAMIKKFKLLQQTTANRVFKLIEGSKSKVSVFTETTGQYISPKEFEDLTALIEKQNLQYQSAIMQLERYREDNSSKSALIDKIESEKTQLNIELTNTKRELEYKAKEIGINSKEIERLKEEIEVFNNNGQIKAQSLTELSALANAQNNKISVLTNNLLKNEQVLKEKEERIKKLEDKLEKIRTNKKEKTEEEKPNLIKFDMKKAENNEVNYKRDRFEDMIKPSVKRVKNKVRHTEMIKSHNSDSFSNVEQRIDSDVSETSTLPSGNDPRYQDFTSRNFSNFSQESQKLRNETNLSTRANSRDTQLTRETPLARVDEYKEIQEFNAFKDNKTNKDTKDKKTTEIKDQKDNKLNPSLNREEQKKLKSREKQRFEEKKDPKDYESDEDYQMNRSIQWDIAKSHLDSRDSKKISDFDSTEAKKVSKDGKEYFVVDKGVYTHDLKMIQVEGFSKGVQVSEETENIDSKSSYGRKVYFLPYNPNNTYGLKGDNYYHTKQNVFQAQPRIPDLASSVLFENSYFLEKNREKYSELPSFMSNCNY